MIRFFGYFAAAYGTFWLIIMTAAIVSQSHIDAGEFGFFGFPIIAFFYALIRLGATPDLRDENTELREALYKLETELDRRNYDQGDSPIS